MSTPEPPEGVRDLARRGVRFLAAAVVALLVAVVAAWAGGSPALPLVAGAVAVAVGWLLQRRAPTPSPSGTSAIVAGAVLLVLGVRSVWMPTGDALDVFLTVAGTAFAAAGLAIDERRLVSLGVLQWALVAGRPDAGSVPFRHCLVATDLAVPVPHLTPLLLVAGAALVVGTAQRFVGWRREAGRGAEVTGLALLHGTLLAKAVELPDLEVLCGAGRGIDVGWVAVGLAVAVLSALYGFAGRDAVWAAVGAGALAAHGLVATVLSGEPIWAAIALLPLGVGLGVAERVGIGWPREPGYGRRRPWQSAEDDGR